MGWGSCSSAAYHHCCCSAAPWPSCANRLLSSPTLKQPNSTKNRSLVGLLQETSTPATRMTWCGEVERNSSAGSRRILSWAAMAVLYTTGHAPSRPAALEAEATAAAVPLAGYALGSAARLPATRASTYNQGLLLARPHAPYMCACGRTLSRHPNRSQRRGARSPTIIHRM